MAENPQGDGRGEADGQRRPPDGESGRPAEGQQANQSQPETRRSNTREGGQPQPQQQGQQPTQQPRQQPNQRQQQGHGQSGGRPEQNQKRQREPVPQGDRRQPQQQGGGQQSGTGPTVGPEQSDPDAFGPAGDFDPENARRSPKQQAKQGGFANDPAVEMPGEQQQSSPDADHEVYQKVVSQDAHTAEVSFPVEGDVITFEIYPIPREKRNKYSRQYPPGLFDAMQMARDAETTDDGELTPEARKEIEAEIDEQDMIPTEEGTEALVNTVVDACWHPRISPTEMRDFIRTWSDDVLVAVALRCIVISNADNRVEDFRFE